jgi:hypothetical protein
MCAQLLDPLQPFLIGATSACVQPPVHDALDAVSLRSWLNNPWGSCMADELYKGANIVNAFSQVSYVLWRGGGGGEEVESYSSWGLLVFMRVVLQSYAPQQPLGQLHG